MSRISRSRRSEEGRTSERRSSALTPDLEELLRPHESVRQVFYEQAKRPFEAAAWELAPGVPRRALSARERLGRLWSTVYPVSLAKHAVRRSEAVPRWLQLRSLWMQAPSRVRFCVRRKQRKEVLFALGRAGYSGSARKMHWRRNASSQYSC